MSDFWKSDLGEVSGKPEDAFAKSFTIVPDGTMALAKIETFMNDENQDGFKCLIINWLLSDGDFKGSKVTQKIKVFGGEPQYDKDPAKTRHRALNMLKLLYQQFGLKPETAEPPADKELMAFHGKIAGIKIRETEPNAEGRSFNWVAEVHKASGFKSETGVKLTVTHTPSGVDSAFSRNTGASDPGIDRLTDDIPF